MWRRVAFGAVVLGLPGVTQAGNNDEVNAGSELTLTGGAVVATTYTGAALWYNPAGLAATTKAAFELTGFTLQFQIVSAPGVVSIDTDPAVESEGRTVNVNVIPEALTFVLNLKNELKLGLGFFNSSIRRALFTEQAETAGTTPEVQVVGGQSTRAEFYHVSAGLANTVGKGRRLQLGGAFDLVVGTGRIDSSFNVAYDDGALGQASEGEITVDTTFGVQFKGGLQWIPHENWRLGFSVASPTYAFLRLDRGSLNFSQSPPAGTTLSPDDPDRQLSGGEEFRTAEGGWWGVEPGNARLGVAYLARWGWVEGDVVSHWRLRTADFGIDLKRAVNVQLGGAFRLNPFMKLGVGLFTDRNQVDQLQRSAFGSSQIDFYGGHLGFLLSNQEVHPGFNPETEAVAESKESGIDLAVGLRYAYGSGVVLGLEVPAAYDPQAIARASTAGDVHEISLNFAAKFQF